MIRQHMVLASAAGLVSALLVTGCGSADDISSAGPDEQWYAVSPTGRRSTPSG